MKYQIYDIVRVNNESNPYHGQTGKVIEIHFNPSPVLISIQLDKNGKEITLPETEVRL